MAFFEDILSHYAWQGLALVGVVLVLWFVQLYYYAIAYNRIYKFRLMRRRKLRCENPAISVIVAVRGENEGFLCEELPRLLAQQYHTFEVVVIYIGSDIDYYDELQRIRDNYSNMRLTKMGGNPQLYISTKQALNVGIKSAQYDNLLFTTTGAIPRSDEWIAYMAKGFERGMVVAGPMVSNFEEHNVKTYIMRLVEMHRYRQAFACAVQGKLYYAPRGNYGFTRRLYESTRGYNHLNMDIGENDLYLQSVATPKRTAVVLSPHAVVGEESSSSWSEWMELMRYYDATRAYYDSSVKMFCTRELGSRVLLFLSALVALVVLPLELKLGIVVLMLLRYLVVVWSSCRVAKKLGESGIGWLYWIYDIVGPAVELMIRSRSSQTKPKLWR